MAIKSFFSRNICMIVGCWVGASDAAALQKIPLKTLGAFWSVQQNRPFYKQLRKRLMKSLHAQDCHVFTSVVQPILEREEDREDVTRLLGIFVERLSPQQLVKLTELDKHDILIKKRFEWDGMVIDALLASLDTFEKDERYRILGLLVRYKPHNFALLQWCCDDLMLAYEYIGYDGIKALYDNAFKHEKYYIERAYEICYKDLHRAQRPLYFLDRILFFDY